MPTEETKTIVTERVGMTTDKQQNAVTIVGMPPWQIVAVRAARVYLMTLVGLLTVTGSPIGSAAGLTLTVNEFFPWLMTCASVSVAPAVVSLLQNAIELLAKLDATNPGLRA